MYKFKPGVGGVLVPDFTQFEGRLAESWAVSKDKKTYTFKLRKNVTSAWGNRLTAADYLWSLQRAFNMNGIGKLVQTSGGVTKPSYVEALDAHTLRFKLDYPNPLFLHTRTTYLGPVFDSTEAKKHVTASDPNATGWISANGGGFAPYQVARAVAGSQTVFKAVGGYYRGAPAFTLVVVDAVPDTAARLSSLSGGAVDVAQFLDYQQIGTLRGSGNVYVANAQPGSGNIWLILNTQYPALQDKRVRQAIAYALPYDAIAKGVYRGFAQVYKAGKTGASVQVTYAAGKSEDQQVAILVGQALSEIGLKPALNQVTAAIFAQLKTGSASVKAQSQILVSSGDQPSFPDVVFASEFFFKTGALFNRGWSNHRLDYLTGVAAHESRPSFRQSELYQMQAILMEELPYIGIAMIGRPFAFLKNVQGYRWLPDNYLRYYDLHRV